jgi:L-amino acid N-acyltransferase YncA
MDGSRGLVVRRAEIADAAEIARIYNEGILDRLATLETELRSAEERAQWLAGKSERHPVLVVESSGVIAGWGSLNLFNPRAAYAHVADFSVYVSRNWRGRGVGSVLLDHLIATARQLGFHKLVLAAFPFNTAGVALYTRAGFRQVGIYREQGRLDGRWVDIVVMERLL